ncbi:hypothetical protein [Haloarcula nitratireducens]|uniref:Uncharacterized protein n=1 Tax=Haloarcula nitratireducens TaxID=2487749 RepID=A0AAW4PG84_9EURY|nr:hypothetical protein [Halomicroarcula nitratireducens]MBX0296247.1 hypothetical protein [Halomicroarcula nitratireducens]
MTDEPRRSADSDRATRADGGDASEEWTDIHLSEPEPDSWEIDLHVEHGAVETVVLRLHADGLPGVVNSLLSDVDDELVRRVLAYAVERQDVDPATLVDEE